MLPVPWGSAETAIQFQWLWVLWLAPLPFLVQRLPAAQHWRSALYVPFYQAVQSIKTPFVLRGGGRWVFYGFYGYAR